MRIITSDGHHGWGDSGPDSSHVRRVQIVPALPSVIVEPPPPNPWPRPPQQHAPALARERLARHAPTGPVRRVRKTTFAGVTGSTVLLLLSLSFFVFAVGVATMVFGN
jgi:hypothetical protein